MASLICVLLLSMDLCKMSSLNNYPFAIVRFNDGIYANVSKKDIRYTLANSVVSKWKSSWYDVKLVGFIHGGASYKEFVTNLNYKVPTVVLERCDSTKNSGFPSPEDAQIRVVPECDNSPTCEGQQSFLRHNDVSLLAMETEHFNDLVLPPIFCGSLITPVSSEATNTLEKNPAEELDLVKLLPVSNFHDTSWTKSKEDEQLPDLSFAPCPTFRNHVISNETIYSFEEANSSQPLNSLPLMDPAEEVIPLNTKNNLSNSLPSMNPAEDISLNMENTLLSIDEQIRSPVTDEELSSPAPDDYSLHESLFDDTPPGNSPAQDVQLQSPSKCNSGEIDVTRCQSELLSFNLKDISGKCLQNFTSAQEIVSAKKCHSKKRNYCIFCKKFNTNIERHFQQVHKKEKEVKEFVALPKRCSQRRKLIGELRHRGNFEYNYKIKNSHEQFIVARNVTSREVGKWEYTACPKCKVFVTKPAFRRHYRTCTNLQGNRGALSKSRSLFNDIHPSANESLRTVILPIMREDDVFSIIKYDKLIILYGNAMAMKYKSHHHHAMIRSRLRIVGRFLKLLKSIDPEINELASLYRPCMFDVIVQGLHHFGDINTVSGYYNKPTLPYSIGTALKYIGNLYKMECIKAQNETDKKDVEDVLLLLNVGLEGPINKTASESLLHNKRQKKEVLPLTDDIKKLQEFLALKQREYYNKMNEDGFSDHNWINLLKMTLISILVFNRKRPGELERALVTDLQSLYHIDEQDNPETFNALSDEARKAASSYFRFTIRGKLARGVPVFLITIITSM